MLLKYLDKKHDTIKNRKSKVFYNFSETFSTPSFYDGVCSFIVSDIIQKFLNTSKNLVFVNDSLSSALSVISL